MKLHPPYITFVDGKNLPFVSKSFQMEAKSIEIFQEINVVKLCKSFYQGNKHYELYICFATLVYPRASRFFFFCEEELHLAFFHRPWWMGYVGISFSRWTKERGRDGHKNCIREIFAALSWLDDEKFNEAFTIGG